jgi:uncharacterized glyoxalase superfamily protein PhnB
MSASVKPIPAGQEGLIPHLVCSPCSEAIEFYKKAFGAEERARMPGPNNTLMHAEIKIGTSVIMISDAVMTPATQSNLHLYVTDVDVAYKRALDAGCQVVMPLGDMFWGDRYGVVSDKWNNRWSLATHKEDVAPADMQKRMAEAMKQMK